MSRLALALLLATVPLGALAQERVRLTRLEDVTQKRVQAWQDLERRWQGMRGLPAAHGFARNASLVCAQAVDWPVQGEPRAGFRQALIGQSCAGALTALVAQGSRQVGAADTQTWKRGFVPGEDAQTLDCLALDQMAQLIDRVDVTRTDPALMQRFQDTHRRCAQQQNDAERGRDALALPPCERIAALAGLLNEQGKLDWAARHLANTDDAEELESRWNRLAGRDARYAHVVAYHYSEARIELASFAEHAATVRELAPESAEEVRQAFVCLGEFRGAQARLRELERRLEEAARAR